MHCNTNRLETLPKTKNRHFFAEFLSTPPSALLQTCFSRGFIELVCGVSSVSLSLSVCLSLSLALSISVSLSLSLRPQPQSCFVSFSVSRSVGRLVGLFGRSVRSVGWSVCLTACLPACLSGRLPACLPVGLSVFFFLSVSVNIYLPLSIFPLSLSLLQIDIYNQYIHKHIYIDPLFLKLHFPFFSHLLCIYTYTCIQIFVLHIRVRMLCHVCARARACPQIFRA